MVSTAGEVILRRMVGICSTAPARLSGLFPRKGTIAVGSDADLVLSDPAEKETLSTATHSMRVDDSLYEGMEVTGRVRSVVPQGRLVVDEGRSVRAPGQGQVLHRGPSGRD